MPYKKKLINKLQSTMCMSGVQSSFTVYQFHLHPYVHSRPSSGFMLQKICDKLNKNNLRPLKKGAAKQSRIKRIIWHLRWVASTRADISLRLSGSVRTKTDIKLRPSTLVRKRTDIKLRPIGLVRSYKD